MRIVNPVTGKTYFRKLRKRIDELGHARELTFSCYKRFKFLDRERTRQWFINSLLEARKEFAVDLWAYVIMPEHVHLLLYPREEKVQAGQVAGSLKESVARPAINTFEQMRRSRFLVSQYKRVNELEVDFGKPEAATIVPGIFSIGGSKFDTKPYCK